MDASSSTLTGPTTGMDIDGVTALQQQDEVIDGGLCEGSSCHERAATGDLRLQLKSGSIPVSFLARNWHG